MIINTTNLCWQWPGQPGRLGFPDISLPAGEHLFIHGPSGSGKTTLLSLLSGLNRATLGTIQVHGQDLTRLSGGARDRLRADRTGVIFQQFNLVPYLSALDNVTLPCRLSGRRRQQAGDPATAARQLMTALGLPAETLTRKAPELSTGQQQRVAAARALIGAPPLILADEPTSALDVENRDRFVALLLEQAARTGSSVVFVSHDPALASHFSNHLELLTDVEVNP
ncbi:ATP-binding cassette domain-containing protein [Marinobacter sp.]|uniref:ATP-binding cassette domain-containing protein n=1 Tax=Marinobacter sp. TaxID=50741 RepID=UPI00356AABB0